MCMPLKRNIPDGRKDWRLTTCPVCGEECWSSDAHELALKLDSGLKVACTMCQCTKAELLRVIDRARRHGLSDWAIKAALNDLELERLHKSTEEADRLNEFAHGKRMEYCDLMKPYDGWLIKEIPLDVLEKADALLKQAQEADRKWNKLMGVQK